MTAPQEYWLAQYGGEEFWYAYKKDGGPAMRRILEQAQNDAHKLRAAGFTVRVVHYTGEVIVA